MNWEKMTEAKLLDIHKLYALTVICLLASFAAAEELTLNINVKKPIAVVSEKFLSITLDPVALFNTDLLSDVERSISIARALAPAYVRIGGPRSNSYVFERGLYPQETQSDPGLTFTETHWINLHQWAERSGLDVVACIAPQMSEGARAWDPRNALDLISFSDHMGYNTSWQLGYECQANCKMSGADLGRDVARLRSMLDAFPRYAESNLVVGPDVVAWKTKQEQQYLQDYFNAAAASLSAVTWHPDFAGVSLEEDGVSMHYDNLAFEKETLYKAFGRQISKKPLWIAESKPEDCKRQFLGALVWARRLGNSARLGTQVLMRQPENSNFLRPTPDFWVSMLHKMLVGREVLDTKIATGNRTHVHFYTQCTKPSSKYEKGSITIFGINLTPAKITASLKGLKIKTVHKYVLLPGYDSSNRMFAETVLLNNGLLGLINGKEIPDIDPIVYNVDKDVKLKLPSGGIGFWVLPGLKIKSCMGQEDEIPDKNIVRKANKRLEDLEMEEDLEPGDDSSREVPDVADSFEERKSLLRQQLQKRLPARRSVRHKEMDKDDERSLRRSDSTKRDVHRHEKIGRKKEHSTNIDSEEKNENSEEAIERKILDGQPLDSGEEIRAKLYEYKRRLADHEHRKKQRGKTTMLAKERPRDGQDNTSNKNMDTGKVIEALTLITKVESAMKGLDKNNDTQQRISLLPMHSSGDFSDVTSGLKKSSNDDGLLDEVLNTEKAKRTTVPTKIEDQLKALYRLLSEEKDRKDSQSPLRHRRDLDKRLGDDPLGLRRDSIFLRKRAEAKERRSERRQRIRERIEELRRERESTRKEPRDVSSENNFYGFQYRAPLKNFPEGDLYLQGTTPPTEEQSGAAGMKSEGEVDENEDVWLEEDDGNHMPNEFYENVKLQGYNAKENLKEYGELWEAESLRKDEDNEKNVNEAEYATPEIVTERQLTEAEDRKAKEAAVQQLINYYEAKPQEQVYDFEELRQQQLQEQQQPNQVVTQQQLTQVQPQQQVYYQPQANVNYQQTTSVGNNGKYYTGPQGKFADVNRYYVDSSQYPQQNGETTYRRTKRYISDLEDLLHQEMIDQDDSNLRDCQCRVIRGVETCKDCQVQRERQVGTPYVAPGHVIQNPAIPNYDQKVRVRRNTEEVACEVEEIPSEASEEISVIPEGAPGIPETLSPILEINPEVQVETHEEEIDEAIAPVVIEEDAEPAVSAECIEEPHEAANVEVTLEASKEHMNLENEEDEPLGTRVARKTDSVAKFFPKKKEITTTATPEKKTKANKHKTTVISKTTRNTESTNQTEATDKHVKITKTIDENTDTAATTPNTEPTTGSIAEIMDRDSTKIDSTARDKFDTKVTDALTYRKYQFAPKTALPGANGEDKVSAKPAASIIKRQSASAIEIADPINDQKPLFNTKVIAPVANGENKFNAQFAGSITDRNDEFDTSAGLPIANGEDKIHGEPTTSITKRQNTSNAQISDSNGEIEKTSGDQTTNPSILKKIPTTKSSIDVSTTTLSPAKKLTIPPKTNGTTKLEELIKARHARLTTRAEALAALRKENENRRAKKMIEASLKLLESESARFAEYEKKRREQLDRLKGKLRAKREKMLQQYREELIEAINDSDQKQRNLRRRDLFDGYPRNDEESGFLGYSPIIEMRPFDENPNSRQARSKSEGQYFMSDDSDEYEESKNTKRSMLLDQPFEDEELFDSSGSEFRSANFKRSPMVVVDYNKKPQIMEGDSGEYYTPEQQKQLEQRVVEAQLRLQQQRQQQQLLMQQRREELLKQQKELQKREEEVKLQKQAAAQHYAQAHQLYPSAQQQLQQPYYPAPQQQQQPHLAALQQPPHLTASQQQQKPHMTESHQLSQPIHHYSQSQHNTDGVMPPNHQYSQQLQSVQQQQAVHSQSPTSAQYPGTTQPGQLPTSTKQVDPKQQQQQFVQPPNADYYIQQPSIPPQQPGLNYYEQKPPATDVQQPSVPYYNYPPANAQQPNAGYYNQQASVSQQLPTNSEYYNRPAGEQQQYYYPPASTAQQNVNPEYYKQPLATSQQQTDIKSNNKNTESTHITSTGVNKQSATLQNVQSVATQHTTNFKGSNQSPTTQKPVAQTGVTQQRDDIHLYNDKQANPENLQDLKVYKPVPETNQSPTPFDMNNYYQFYQNLNQQDPGVNHYEISPTAYEGIRQAPAQRGYKKSKRSNLKVLEINPSIYDDDESDYNLHELFMKPSSRFSSRNYRHYPFDPSDSKRYRRDVPLDNEKDGPLSISLGLDLSNMMPRENNPATPTDFIRRKRATEDNIFESWSPVNKNVKKVYKLNYGDKKIPKKLTILRRINEKDITETIPRVRKLRRIDDSIQYLPSVPVFTHNNLGESKDIDTFLTRRRRSPEAKYESYLQNNHIKRNEDSDMNEIWNDIIEMKQDKALDEYDRRKDELFSNFIKDQNSFEKHLQPDIVSTDHNKESMIQKVAESTTKVNIESMIVEAIPKLENVITGGIEKAQNITGNFEDFIENFDEQFDETTENIQETSETSEDVSNGRLSHSVFKTMIGGVKKFFGFITGITRIFHNH